MPFPEPWATKLDDFERLLVLKCLRPDKVINAMQIYLAKYLGQQFIEPQIANLSAVYMASSNTKPIVFILSPGIDPVKKLYKFAEIKMERKLHSISLGQNQEFKAQAMLKQAVEVGNWVFFQVRNSFIYYLVLVYIYKLIYSILTFSFYTIFFYIVTSFFLIIRVWRM